MLLIKIQESIVDQESFSTVGNINPLKFRILRSYVLELFFFRLNYSNVDFKVLSLKNCNILV